MTEKYHFNVPGPAIWISHIIIGLFLAYFGYASMKHTVFPDYIYITIIIIGVLAALYHIHIWILGDDDDNERTK